MYINIRDDDCNFFTSFNELKLAYEEYLGVIPITLACTPFVSEHSFIMNKLDGNREQQFKQLKELEYAMSASDIANMNRLYPLGDNIDLVKSIKPLVREGMLEIALHGYSHRFYDNGAEFINKHVNYYNVIEGKRYLERLFDTELNFFVPPSNRIDVDALIFLKKSCLKLLTSGVVDESSVVKKILLYVHLLMKQPRALQGLLSGKLTLNPVIISNVICYRSATFRLDDTCLSYMNRCRSKMEQDGFISIATHYTTLSTDESYRKRFFSTIEYIRNEYKNSEFISMDKLSRKLS